MRDMRQRFLLLVICMAAMLVIAAPVAANSLPTTGTRISLFNAPATFPAGTPFYVEHGTGCEPGVDSPSACMNSDTHFDLYLDGALQPSSLDIENSPDGWLKLNLTNYSSGLPVGRHSLVGVWVAGGSAYLALSARINFTR